ncbi:hypothetical protein NUU61_008917 [Penicillium alfredii]|uniref:HCNGP-like protein n=1 Tax=Penicillium alfredii TaxID=1506179 RepID=A0A9W9EM16_9EURO|nr:uncharacterized protein NUU61_008917 [Penicillium alfredii]KAJ5084338.1 hypothetical protein NUU61_008917 [Penicillium alfredii]
MLGLGAYDSSSEDEVEAKVTPSGSKGDKGPPVAASPTNTGTPSSESLGLIPFALTSASVPTPIHHERGRPLSTEATHKLPNGPVLGPASIERVQPLEAEQSANGRSSPFAASRTLIQDLTLPPVPNLDIPLSPPGSPDPAANAKFEHFLSLKKQGVHFNSKLASSSSLKNPSLLMKMMDHAGIGERSQYDTSLPADVWDTSTLPLWGFKEELLKTQQDLRRQMEDKKASGQRDTIEFVSGSPAASRLGPASDSETRRKPHP